MGYKSTGVDWDGIFTWAKEVYKRNSILKRGKPKEPKQKEEPKNKGASN